jgi:hypothetical protein
MFMTWLVNTAVGFGYKLHPQTESVQMTEANIPKGPRPKGKTRKLAREKAFAASPSRGTAPKIRKLTIKALLECAEKIATATSPSVLVSYTVYNSLLNVIELRGECSAWFAE